jgi:very-short-patch-repair endonuclease
VLAPADITRVKDIPVTNPIRTQIDCGMSHQPLQITSMIGQACYLDLLDIHELRAFLDGAAHVPGTAAVRAAVDHYVAGSAGTRSRSEDELVRLLELAGLPPARVNVRGATGVHGLELDFVRPRRQVIVEVDGGHHQLPGVAEQDARRHEMLRLAGWTVLRFAHDDIWKRPRYVIAAITTALGR